MFQVDTHARVRYAETDQMGYLYYGNYATYFEVGRVETMRSAGMSYKQLEESGIWMPVVSLETRYVRPAFYDDLLTIRTQIRRLPDKYIVFHTDILNPQGKLCAAGRVRLCFYDAATKKVIPAPTAMIDLLLPYFE